jgi:hypothetical protein
VRGIAAECRQSLPIAGVRSTHDWQIKVGEHVRIQGQQLGVVTSIDAGPNRVTVYNVRLDPLPALGGHPLILEHLELVDGHEQQ